MSLTVRPSPDVPVSSLNPPQPSSPPPVSATSNFSDLPKLPQAHSNLSPIETANTHGNITMGAAIDSDSPLSSPVSVASASSKVSAVSNKSKASAISKQSKASAVSDVSKKRTRTDELDIDATPPPMKATKRTPAKPKATASLPASNRPSRSRKAPERFVEPGLDNVSKKKSSARKGLSRIYDPEYATTNSQSRLGKADLYHMLLEPAAWTSLAAPQQASLVKMLPPSRAKDDLLAAAASGATELSRPKELQISFNMFRTDVAKFQADLTNGHLAKTWLLSAAQSVRDRADGRFDDWKEEEAESWWGQKAKAALL